MYWLTCIHSGNFRDIPLIEVSIEDGSPVKHCRKERRPIIFTVNAQENKAEEPRCQYCDSPMKANILQFTYITPPSQTLEGTSLNHKSMFRSRYVILKHTYRLDVMHAGDTNQTTSTQTLLFPNALTLTLALAPTTTQVPIHPPPTNHPTCTLKTTQRPMYMQSPTSLNTHLSTVLTSHHQKEKFGSQKHESS